MRNKLTTATFIGLSLLCFYQSWHALGVMALWISAMNHEGVMFNG